MLGINRPYPREARQATPYGREGNEGVFPPGRGRILWPSVQVAGGRSQLNRFLRATGIQNWHVIFGLDIGGVIGDIPDEDTAAEMLHRIGELRTGKLLIVTRIHTEDQARRATKMGKPGSLLINKAAGIIAVLDSAQGREPIRFWCAQESSNEEVREKRFFHRSDLIFTNGSKGEALGAIGNAVIMVDNH